MISFDREIQASARNDFLGGLFAEFIISAMLRQPDTVFMKLDADKTTT